ncbi:hypothetical protein C9F11_08850 [Streptomyces sp. YIM 121038]|nr:hypothetical protein [Streptomyces sp. YIM 121038]QCX75459.1 hypothetical protein C9F11_08850 [Streptomyces sp. YIM 121038]
MTQPTTEPTWADIKPQLERQLDDLTEASKKLAEVIANPPQEQ